MEQPEDLPSNAGLGCALEAFTEVEEVKSLINGIQVTYTNPSKSEKSFERFISILNLYQEQPHLLDRKLDDLLASMISIIQTEGAAAQLQHEVFKYMHIVMKVRGYKVVINHLPHEVVDLEPVLQLLELQDPSDLTTWQTVYCLILWLSIIVFIPFHMSKLDSFAEVHTAGGQLTVRQRILNVCKIYCLRSDVCRVAALLASYFLKRSDVKHDYLAPFVDWACLKMLGDESVLDPCGPQAAIAAILKHSDREDLLPLGPVLVKTIINSNYKEHNSGLVRKFGMKIIQRIGLTFLPERVAAWRYQRGHRSLEANLASKVVNLSEGKEENNINKNVNTAGEDECDFDVPEEIETIIEELIQGLRFSDNNSRWSAAKGIGRITNRLPKDLANEVVGSVLELLSYREKDGAWHGGCLALAELGRRGLLLPERLAEVVPKVRQALMYDEWRTFSSVGCHVRDAACFVCWAFARAFDADIIAPYVQEIASSLLVVACFDREVQCRRAASAAFQENVGRQGAFPHGIDIVTKADYTAVGVRSHSFLDISVYIAQFEEYVHPLLEHLLSIKIYHWDPTVRELSGKAIFSLTSRDPQFMVAALGKLCVDVDSIELNVRHGAVLAIGEILHALALCDQTKPATTCGDSSKDTAFDMVFKKLLNLKEELKEHQHFRGIGGEHMKQACSYMIEKCCHSDMSIEKFSALMDVWMEFLYACLRDDCEPVRTRSAAALSAVFARWYALDSREAALSEIIDTRKALVRSISELYSKEVLVHHEIIRRGFSTSLSLFPKPLLKETFDAIFPALIGCTKITASTEKWAESRRESIRALTNICRTLDGDLITLPGNLQTVETLFVCFLDGFKDYTQDKRGDIGAWVREAVMTGLQVLVNLLLVHDRTQLTAQRVTAVLTGLAQQSVEKIDRTRAHAGIIFAGILHSDPIVPEIPYHSELKKIFPKDSCDKQIIWISAAETFPLFIKLLAMPPFTYSVMHGLVLSVGGITESLVKNSSLSLFAYMKSIQTDPEEIERLCLIISEIFCNNQYNDRVIVPMLSFLDRIISSNSIRKVLDNEKSKFAPSILNHIRIEVRKSRDMNKLMAAVSVLCQLIQVNGDVSKRSLFQLCIFLNNRFVYIRKSTASRLYEALTMYGDESAIPLENLDEVISLLGSTNWEAEVAKIKPVRNKLCDLMGIERPVPIAQPTSQATDSLQGF